MSRSKRSGGRRRGSSVAQAATTARARPAQDAQRARSSGALARPEATIALGALVFLLGGYWDVAWHIEIGRDTFWSPPHLVLYSGILLILAACAYAFAAASRLGSAGRRAWPGPGPVIAALGAALALASAPIDDTWHRLFGLDVTLWSPPHLMLIGGMAIAAFGAVAGFASLASRRDPARLAALWRSTAARWTGPEVGLYLAGGVLLAIVLGVLGEYDYDVSRYPVIYHPILLAALGALVLAMVARAGGRVGSATLVAAAYTGVRIVAYLELRLLAHVTPQIPLVLLAAPVLDLLLWKLGGRLGPWAAAAAAGAGYAAALLVIEWPYTSAYNAVVWRPDVLARAALPALVAAAAGAMLGWALGGWLRPVAVTVEAASRRERRAPQAAPAAVWNGWSGGPGNAIVLALVGLAIVAIFPAVRRAGAPPSLGGLEGNGQRGAAGTLQITPAVPVVGQPLQLHLTLTDPTVASAVQRAPALPFESPRAGDVATGALRSTAPGGQSTEFEGSFVPREPGRRWISIYFPSEQGRMAASAAFVVYTPAEAAALGASQVAGASLTRPVLLRPEPGPEEDLPGWLQPATYAAIAVLLLGEAAAVAFTLRRAARADIARAGETSRAASPVAAAPAAHPATRRRGAPASV